MVAFEAAEKIGLQPGSERAKLEAADMSMELAEAPGADYRSKGRYEDLRHLKCIEVVAELDLQSQAVQVPRLQQSMQVRFQDVELRDLKDGPKLR